MTTSLKLMDSPAALYRTAHRRRPAQTLRRSCDTAGRDRSCRCEGGAGFGAAGGVQQWPDVGVLLGG